MFHLETGLENICKGNLMLKKLRYQGVITEILTKFSENSLITSWYLSFFNIKLPFHINFFNISLCIYFQVLFAVSKLIMWNKIINNNLKNLVVPWEKKKSSVCSVDVILTILLIVHLPYHQHLLHSAQLVHLVPHWSLPLPLSNFELEKSIELFTRIEGSCLQPASLYILEADVQHGVSFIPRHRTYKQICVMFAKLDFDRVC